jgi:GAF domain-containing protein
VVEAGRVPAHSAVREACGKGAKPGSQRHGPDKKRRGSDKTDGNWHEARECELIKQALAAIRTHLGMDVAFVSQFEADHAILRVVGAPGLEHVIKAGDARPLDEVYCRHILEGRLPQLIPDTAAEPAAAAMPITRAMPIGKYIGVPIQLPDGSIYGMFCCLGAEADRSLRERDLQMLKAFADLAAF